MHEIQSPATPLGSLADKPYLVITLRNYGTAQFLTEEIHREKQTPIIWVFLFIATFGRGL